MKTFFFALLAAAASASDDYGYNDGFLPQGYGAAYDYVGYGYGSKHDHAQSIRHTNVSYARVAPRY